MRIAIGKSAPGGGGTGPRKLPQALGPCRDHRHTRGEGDVWDVIARYNKKAETWGFRLFGRKNLAATYSRGVYKTTTIGKTVFDGRVRNGNGSDHSFMATKKV